MPKLTRHQPRDHSDWAYDLVKLQENVDVALRSIRDTVLLEDVDLVSGQENWVLHGLKKPPREFWLVHSSEAISLYYIDDSTADLTKYLPLAVSNSATVKLRIR